jgi:hypothetical protein
MYVTVSKTLRKCQILHTKSPDFGKTRNLTTAASLCVLTCARLGVPAQIPEEVGVLSQKTSVFISTALRASDFLNRMMSRLFQNGDTYWYLPGYTLSHPRGQKSYSWNS